MNNNFDRISSNIIAKACRKHRKLLLSLMLFGGMIGLTGCGGDNIPHIPANPLITYQKSSNIINNNNNTRDLATHSFSSPSLDRTLASYFQVGYDAESINNIGSDSTFYNDVIENSTDSDRPNPSVIFSIKKNGTLLAKPCLKSHAKPCAVHNIDFAHNSNSSKNIDDEGPNPSKVKDCDFITTKLTNNTLFIRNVDDNKFIKLKLHSIAHAKKGHSIKYTFYPVEKSARAYGYVNIPNKQAQQHPIILETRN